VDHWGKKKPEELFAEFAIELMKIKKEVKIA
jgi:hypothetical protein